MTDLADGESTEMKGSAAKPYVLNNTGGVYSCSCPAWRNQSLPIEKRTCKHLRNLRGDAAEKERTGGALPTRAKKSKSNVQGPPILLAQKWDNALDLTDWWISEKLDGVRAYWDGQQFLSRQGNVYHAPDWFVEDLPDCPLDGELWIDRSAFQRTISIVRRQDKSDHWRDVKFVIFDAPSAADQFEDRLEFLAETFPAKKRKSGFAGVLKQTPCKGVDHIQKELQRIESIGGEGLMLREPQSTYEVGRSMTLLKVKTFHDAEATVIGHQPGRGKHKGKLGALEIQLPDGTQFKVGTGFSDAQRTQPPAMGSVVTFRYQELTDAGVPRFHPSFGFTLVEQKRLKLHRPERKRQQPERSRQRNPKPAKRRRAPKQSQRIRLQQMFSTSNTPTISHQSSGKSGSPEPPCRFATEKSVRTDKPETKTFRMPPKLRHTPISRSQRRPPVATRKCDQVNRQSCWMTGQTRRPAEPALRLLTFVSGDGNLDSQL